METFFKDIRLRFVACLSARLRCDCGYHPALGIGEYGVQCCKRSALAPLPCQDPAVTTVGKTIKPRWSEREWLSPAAWKTGALRTASLHLSGLNNWGPTLTGIAEPGLWLGRIHDMLPARH